MSSIIAGFSTFFEKLISIFSTYNIVSDTLDLLLLTFIIYYFIKLIRDTRALTFAKGLAVFAVVYFIVLILDMQASAFLFSKIFESFFLIIIVIFAPEIRKVLENMGNTRTFSSLMSIFGRSGSQNIAYNEAVTTAINEICRAVSDMSDKQIGALMIFERGTPLGEIIDTGTVIDANISSELIGNIFYPKSPLHDGAAVIRDGRLYAAGCILPLTSKSDLSSELGTRHRAAIGMSEQSDALVLVVSEETGAISISVDGTLKRNISDGEVREVLLKHLTLPDDTKKELKPKFARKGGETNGK